MVPRRQESGFQVLARWVGGVEELGLFLGVDGVGTAGGAAGLDAGDVAEVVAALLDPPRAVLDEVPRAHVLGLLLEPEDLVGVRVLGEHIGHALVRPGVELLDPHDGDRDLALVAGGDGVLGDLAGGGLIAVLIYLMIVTGKLTVNCLNAYGAFMCGVTISTSSASLMTEVVKGKSVTDMRMVIDTMDLMFRGHVDGFGIMSSDSDFTPLVTRLRQDGIVVYGFGSTKTPQAFKSVCTRFIDVDQLIRQNPDAFPGTTPQ